MNKHPDDMQAASKPGHARGRIVTELRKTIVGMDETIPRMSIAIFALGHCLLAGVALAGTGVLEGQAAPHGRGSAAKPAAFVWPSAVPDGCPFPPSETLKGVRFTDRHQAYRGGDTWYPCWADDGNLYSPWTDGGLEGMISGSSHGEQAKTGHAVMIGDDPMNLELRNTSPGTER
jgi:hypothetical protein